MEIEMKYNIPDKECAEQLWEDEYLQEIGDEDTRSTVVMKAAYFDTDDYILSQNDIAFRVRLEGNRIVASLKWNGESSEGLHVREEINVPVVDESAFIEPSPELFIESDPGREMLNIIGDKKLHNLLETRFLRKSVRVDTGKGICEVAIDTGEIITDFGSIPICEMEIELFSGEQETVIDIGTKLAEKYSLTPEDRSKYARGLSMIKNGIVNRKNE